MRRSFLCLVFILGLVVFGSCKGSAEGQTGEQKQEETVSASETEKEKVKAITPVSSEDIHGHYICEEPGFDGMFELELHDDGSAGYMEGGASSYMGQGFWTISGNRLTLMDFGYGVEWDIYFTVEAGALIYDKGASDSFLYADIPDGARFLNEKNTDEAWKAALNERIQKVNREPAVVNSEMIEAMDKKREEILNRVNKYPFQGSDFQGSVCFDASMHQTDPSAPVLIWVEDAFGNKLWESTMGLLGGEVNSFYLYQKDGSINYIIEYNTHKQYHFYMFSLDATGAKVGELTYDAPENIDRKGFSERIISYFEDADLIAGTMNGVMVGIDFNEKMQEVSELTVDYYEDCDDEIRKELEEKLEDFFEDKSFEGFDQGHTDVIWYWAALSLYKQGNAMGEDGLLSVSMEAAQKWMEEQFEMPKGSDKRLAEGMPKEDAKHPVSAVDEKLWFYPCVTKENSSFHIQVAQKHDDTYFVGGEVTTDDGETIKTGLFTAEFMKGENGAYKFTRVNTEDFHTSSLVTKSVPGSNEFEKQIKDAWKKVAEAKNVGSTISSVELEKVEEALKEAFGTPMLGSFNQENMFAAVQFYAQKKLHADLTGLSYHESADYYTATIDEFASWMGEMFVVPDAYEEQVKQSQNDQTIRISGDKLVFRFYQPSMSEHFCVDGGREVDGELFIYGHNPDITQAPEHNEQLLGAWYPFYEFAVILVKNEEGRYLIKEFYIR